MKTTSYDGLADSSNVEETSVSDVNRIETDLNVIFKKVNPVYFADTTESQGNEASTSDLGTTSAYCEENYSTDVQTDVNTEDKSETNVSNEDASTANNRTHLPTDPVPELKSNVDQNQENKTNVCHTEKKVSTPEENTAQNEYRNIEIISPEEVQKTDANNERWSDSTSQTYCSGQAEDMETIPSDTEQVLAQCEPVSEYYTASSEVSLLSDVDPPEKPQTEDEEKDVKDKKEGVIAGHVAAMRERFESMTRTNTPCPDLIRSLSPSLEVFRNTSPSPDRLA